MRVLFVFLDGVGLGEDNPAVNPLAAAQMPNLTALLEGRRLLAASAPYDGERASLRGIDPRLGVDGLPQSATGQAALVTGRNVPREVGEHYGPKPNAAVADVIRRGNIFQTVASKGRRAALLNAYPPRYFAAIESGMRLYSSIPLAVTSAGIPLMDSGDLFKGKALSADFTGQGWRTMLGFPDAPVYAPAEAGRRLAEIASTYDFSLFEYWASDYAGHQQDMEAALRLLEDLDGLLGGLVSAWDDSQGLILFTSDHGNIEDLSTRRHTLADVPALVVGSPGARADFLAGLRTLADVTPAILKTIGVD
jgi:2,3-bisphosphoglycerate-independent phosphoglycerate mutase